MSTKISKGFQSIIFFLFLIKYKYILHKYKYILIGVFVLSTISFALKLKQIILDRMQSVAGRISCFYHKLSPIWTYTWNLDAMRLSRFTFTLMCELYFALDRIVFLALILLRSLLLLSKKNVTLLFIWSLIRCIKLLQNFNLYNSALTVKKLCNKEISVHANECSDQSPSLKSVTQYRQR